MSEPGIEPAVRRARPRVVVGTDGSACGTAAVLRAGAEAARRGGSLTIVHSVRVPTPAPPVSRTIDPGQPVRDAAEGVAEDAAAAVLARHPGLGVDSEVLVDLPGDALLEAGKDADLLVVGSRGRGGFKGLLLGSVARYLAARTTCPLLVVRGGSGAPTPDGDLALEGEYTAVGVEDPGDVPAVREALDAGRRWGLPVRAVHAWSWPGYGGIAGPSPGDIAELGDLRREELSRAVGPVRVSYPDVVVSEETVFADAAGTLVDVSAQAAVMVVGVRRRRGPLRHWVGHVAHTVIEHAHCPVLVIPVEDS